MTGQEKGEREKYAQSVILFSQKEKTNLQHRTRYNISRHWQYNEKKTGKKRETVEYTNGGVKMDEFFSPLLCVSMIRIAPDTGAQIFLPTHHQWKRR